MMKRHFSFLLLFLLMGVSSICGYADLEDFKDDILLAITQGDEPAYLATLNALEELPGISDSVKTTLVLSLLSLPGVQTPPIILDFSHGLAEALNIPLVEAGNVFTSIKTDSITEDTPGNGTAINSLNIESGTYSGSSYVRATPNTTNTALILVPTGTGYISAQVPNGANSGGNTRGVNSIDFQMIRSAAAQVASGVNSALVSGTNNTIAGTSSIVGSGTGNTIATNNTECAIGSGNGNTINAYSIDSFIGSGVSNAITTSNNFIGGGISNSITSSNSVIVGGLSNLTSTLAYQGVIGGGQSNQVQGPWAVAAGGLGNTAAGTCSFIGGGNANTTQNSYCVVAGGSNNITSNVTNSFIGGGLNNTINGSASVIGGGQLNTTNGTWSTIGGGYTNIASGLYSTVPGGFTCSALADFSFAAGTKAKADTTAMGAFVLTDSISSTYTCTSPNAMYLRFANGVSINTTTPSTSCALDVAGIVHATSFPTSSDTRLKKNVHYFNEDDGILDKVMHLKPCTFEWNDRHPASHKFEEGQKQIGFIAQDVEEYFPELLTFWMIDHKSAAILKDPTLNPDDLEDEVITDYRALDYSRMVSLLCRAIQELKMQVDEKNIKFEDAIAVLRAEWNAFKAEQNSTK